MAGDENGQRIVDEKNEALRQLLAAAENLDRVGIICQVAKMWGCDQSVAVFLTGVDLVEGKIVVKEKKNL